MKTTTALIITGIALILSAGYADEEFSFDKKQKDKLSSYMKDIFDARIEDDRVKEIKAKQQLKDMIAEIQMKQEMDDLLKYADAWHTIREGTIDTSNAIFKRKGRFIEGEYTDFTETPGRDYKYIIYLPKEYDPKGDKKFPVILFLHPEIEGRKKVEREVPNMLKTLYSDKGILDNYIIIAPLGPMEGKSKRKRKLVDAGEDWEDLRNGLQTAFVGIRIMLEQMVFDRSRVIIDGVGRSGLAAYKYATWYPSIFSAAIGRDAPIEPMNMENLKGIRCLYVSTSENESGQVEAAKSWIETFSNPEKNDKDEVVRDALDVTYLEEGGELLKPSKEGSTAITEWLGEVSKETNPKEIFLRAADLTVAGSYWLKIKRLNAGLDMQLDDPNYPWIRGRIESDSNTIVLESQRVLGVVVFLNDKLVNLDEKVTIILNGKERFAGKIERNLDTMLDLIFYNRAGDYEVYCNYRELTEEE